MYAKLLMSLAMAGMAISPAAAASSASKLSIAQSRASTPADGNKLAGGTAGILAIAVGAAAIIAAVMASDEEDFDDYEPVSP